MIFSAVGGLQPSQQAIDLLHNPALPNIFYTDDHQRCKLFSSVAILIPGLKGIKEGICRPVLRSFGAIYSGVAAAGSFDPMMLSMIIWILPGIVSYLWKRR